MTDEVGNPFGENHAEEVLLDPAPLAKVLVQLRFPPILNLTSKERVARVQESLRTRYPILREETDGQVVLSPQGGVLAQQAQQIWRFRDVDEQWVVGIAPDFVALETSTYDSRRDFVERWTEVLQAVASIEEPPLLTVYDRLGIRYINQLAGEEALGQLENYVRPEVYGPLTIDMPEGTELVVSLSQTHFRLNGPQVQARWGRIPGHATVVPGVQVLDEPSWLLDIDVYFEGTRAFSVEGVTDSTQIAARGAYQFFRWAMSSKFIDTRRRRA